MGLISAIINGLKKTKESISKKLASLFVANELDEFFYDDLEAILLSSDIGATATDKIIEEVKSQAKQNKIKKVEDVNEIIKNILVEMLPPVDDLNNLKSPTVILVVGVNGVGKTTTIGKLASYYKQKRKSVMVVAGDTFRAAASDQLNEWANRAKVKIVKQGEGADPSAVVFDAIASAKAKNIDVLIIDTAGRLHNKVGLMDELSKISRVVTREWPEAVFKKYIVLDATTGQNAINQVETFNEYVSIDGIILTKVDGTAKGGVVIAINQELNMPVLFLGVGEGMDDLKPFNPKEFIDGIF